MVIKIATCSELEDLSGLCYLSKAHWGYDDDFMERCRDELCVTIDDLSADSLVFTWSDMDELGGVAQLVFDGSIAKLEKLFVDPLLIGTGVGRYLFEHAVLRARERGMNKLVIEADPFAEGFYLKMGAVRQGEVASKTMANRWLPFLIYPLDKAGSV